MGETKILPSPMRPEAAASVIASTTASVRSSGTAISGASAGAMVLCSHTARPDRGDVVDGLGLVDGLALPHWDAGVDRRWVLPDVTLWGLPECGGVIIEHGTARGVGGGVASLNDGDGWQPVPR